MSRKSDLTILQRLATWLIRWAIKDRPENRGRLLVLRNTLFESVEAIDEILEIGQPPA